MRSNSFRYLCNEGFKNVWTNRLMTFASIGVLSTCLLLVGFAIILTVNIDNIVGYVGQENYTYIYLKDDAPQDNINSLKQKLESDEDILNISYVSKEQAFLEQKQQLGSDGTLLDGLENDPSFMPASFRIQVKDISKLERVVNDVLKYPIVDTVNSPSNVATVLTQVRSMFNKFGIAIIIILILISLIIISNTIRATIFTRRREIGIMKYVGATNSFIRLPFFIEGITLGLISALFSFIILSIAYSYVVNSLDSGSPFLKSMFSTIVPFSDIALLLAISFFGAGILTGSVACITSLRKHLKV